MRLQFRLGKGTESWYQIDEPLHDLGLPPLNPKPLNPKPHFNPYGSLKGEPLSSPHKAHISARSLPLFQIVLLSVCLRHSMGGCQNFGSFLDPSYNTAPNI